MPVHTYSDDIYSDLHKDALGFRPGQSGYVAWDAMSPDEKQEQWDYLIREMARSEEEERKFEQRCVEAFEASIVKAMEVGAKSREQAIRWLVESSDWGGDIEYFCYLHGLPYNYLKGVDFLPHSCTVVSLEALEQQYEN